MGLINIHHGYKHLTTYSTVRRNTVYFACILLEESASNISFGPRILFVRHTSNVSIALGIPSKSDRICATGSEEQQFSYYHHPDVTFVSTIQPGAVVT
jgi:hypothetical protein